MRSSGTVCLILLEAQVLTLVVQVVPMGLRLQILCQLTLKETRRSKQVLLLWLKEVLVPLLETIHL